MLVAYGTSFEIRIGKGVYLNFSVKGIFYKKMHLPQKNTYSTAISSVDLLFPLLSFMQTSLVFHFKN